jgi:carbon monoxide dehydrogenase subunit G
MEGKIDACRLSAGPRSRRAWRWLGIVALVQALCCHAAAETPIRSLAVAYDGTTYVCDVVMLAPVPRSLAWDVLTDFEHMAQWVPNVRQSKVVQRDDHAVTVEQRGVVKYGLVGFPYATERRIELHLPSTIHSTQTKGSLQRVESLMTLESVAAGTRLTYHLEVVPSRLAGAVLSTGFLEHELAEQFGAIIEEMTRRAH